MILKQQILSIKNMEDYNNLIWNYMLHLDRQISNIYLIQKINAIATTLTAIALILHTIK